MSRKERSGFYQAHLLVPREDGKNDMFIGLGESEEDAKKYCDGCREEVRHIIATDMEEKAKREANAHAIDNITAEIRSTIQPSHDKMSEAYTTLLNYCIKRRTAIFKDTYSQEAIEQHCKDLLEKADSQLDCSMFRQIHRDAGTWPDKDVSQEYADRVYIAQAVYGVPQNYAERYITADMIQEGKFADMTKRTYSRQSVGDLYGKTKKEILDMDSKPSDEHGRMTAGDLYRKTRKRILDSGGEH